MNYDHLALSEFGIPLSDFDIRFDKITHLASRLLSTPVSLLTVIDDTADLQLLKSAVGVPDELRQNRATPLSHSFCKYVRDSGAPLSLTDARADPIHMHNPAIEAFGVVSYLGVPFHGERGEPMGALCCMDIRPREWTDQDVEILMHLASIADDQFQLASAVRDRARAKLLAERAALARSSFLSHANHEVRTPLSAISGAARLLRAASTDTKTRSLVEVIDRNTLRLRALTDDLIRIAELDTATASIEAESVDLIDLIKDIFAKYEGAAQSKGLKLVLSTEAINSLTFLFDAAVLTNVIDRLVSNAIKFTAIGEVRITVEETSPDAFVIIRISDTGAGIGSNLQGKLFEEFEGHDPRTAREGGGTGLGMNILKREIELLGGTISLSSQLGEGTQFEVCLPTARSSGNDTYRANEPQSNSGHLTCLECGVKLSLLRRHLKHEHGMSPEVYLAKWGLPEDFELSSVAYRALRAAAKRDK